MMRVRLSTSNEAVTHRFRKRDIDKAISVNMSDLSLTQPERGSSKTVRRHGNSSPRDHNSSDSFFSISNSHNVLSDLSLLCSEPSFLRRDPDTPDYRLLSSK